MYIIMILNLLSNVDKHKSFVYVIRAIYVYCPHLKEGFILLRKVE